MTPPDSIQSARIHVSLTSPYRFPLTEVTLVVPNPRTAPGAEIKLRILQQFPRTYARSDLRLIFSGKVVGDLDNLPSRAIQSGFSNLNNVGERPPGCGEVELRMQCLITFNQMTSQQWELFCQRSKQTLLSFRRDLCFFWPEEKTFDLQSGITASCLSDENTQKPLGSLTTPASSSFSRPVPRGFDRLLENGLSAHEVREMRGQFWDTLSRTHSLNEVPSGEFMWEAEERWLGDDWPGISHGHLNVPRDALGGNSSVDWCSSGAGIARQSWQHILGSLIGFLWPFSVILFAGEMGQMCPAAVETGIYFGAATNVMFGLLYVLAPSI